MIHKPMETNKPIISMLSRIMFQLCCEMSSGHLINFHPKDNVDTKTFMDLMTDEFSCSQGEDQTDYLSQKI